MAVGDRRNMVFMGTEVTNGRGEFAVTATGMRTELGKIADLIQTAHSEETPLQRRLDQLGKQLAVLALIIVAIVFALGWYHGENLEIMFLTAVSLAVAAVPEGLPATVTIALSLGAQRMLKRHALIRRLPAVETLGSVTVICSDKTGTLTENRMTVTVLDVAGNQVVLQGEQALPIPDLHDQPGMAFLLAGGALCNDAKPQHNFAADADEILGDPTEVALVVAANRQGMHKTALDTGLSARGRASVRFRPQTHDHVAPASAKADADVHTDSAQVQELFARPDRTRALSQYIAWTKGAVDGMLDIAAHVWM